MFKVFMHRYCRHFSDPEIIALLVILFTVFGILFFFGNLLAPLLVALVLAYLLEWPTMRLEKIGCSRRWAASIILILFISIFFLVFFTVMPIIWQQGIYLIQDIPDMFNKFVEFAATIPCRYPVLINTGIVDVMNANIHSRIMTISDSLLKYSLASLVSLLTLIVYLVLVPMMVFFLVKDKEYILNVVRCILPKNRNLVRTVWKEMNQQITNYIRGKILEMILLSIVNWLGFIILGLHYSLLLSVMVGFSVLIPYIGAFIAALPVVGVALFQFGLSMKFWSCLMVYLISQGLDGNFLVPILFSEAVNLHPIVIILSIIIFGQIWGFWGVFFAIPLAALIKAVMHAWKSIL